jgi:hypothetical protein
MDFAIFGTGPLATLLAGLLVQTHKRSVLLVAEPVSQQRLPHALALALPYATRPATWRLVDRGVAETRQLLARMEGADLLQPTGLRIAPDLPDTAAALAHMTHMARATGLRVDGGGTFSRVARFVGEAGLDGAGVRVVAAADAQIVTSPKGAKIAVAGEKIGVRQIVLCCDAAIEERLPEALLPAPLFRQKMTATLTAPAHRLAAPILRFPDRGVMLAQRPDLSVLGLVAGDTDAATRLASAMPGPFPLSRRATSRFHRIVSRDGAPLVGRLPDNGSFIIAGLGESAAFLAPPLARLLADVPTDDEATFFAAHAPGRQTRDDVADYAADGELMA